MSLVFDSLWLTAVFLVAVRLGPLFVMAPVFGTSDIPVRFRVFLTLAFAVAFVSALGTTVATPLSNFGALFAAAASELAIGIVMVFGVFAAFGAFLFGGRLLDIQVG